MKALILIMYCFVLVGCTYIKSSEKLEDPVQIESDGVDAMERDKQPIKYKFDAAAIASLASL